jgi:4-carboxymuconolactone decarboxylase
MTIDPEARARGIDVLEQLGWNDIPTLKAMDEEFYDFTVENCFGSVWARPGMSMRDRELITLAVLVAFNRTDGMKPHLRHAPHLGITEREVRELIYRSCTTPAGPLGRTQCAPTKKSSPNPNRPARPSTGSTELDAPLRCRPPR